MTRAALTNRLLATLSDADLNRWSPHLEACLMRQGQVLQEPDQPVHHVYFPTTAVVSLVYDADEGAAAETAMVGNESVVGLGRAGSSESGAGRALVQSAGWGFRLPAQLFFAALARADMAQLMLRHTQALMHQIAQVAACVRGHSLEQQLCRWLLLCLDRIDTSELTTTQAQIAARLGVRRACISASALELRRLGLIAYTRGRVAVLDRGGLEARVCGCYASIAGEYGRLLRPAG